MSVGVHANSLTTARVLSDPLLNTRTQRVRKVCCSNASVAAAVRPWLILRHCRVTNNISPGLYRIRCPEHGALLSVAWLTREGLVDEANAVLAQIAPCVLKNARVALVFARMWLLVAVGACGCCGCFWLMDVCVSMCVCVCVRARVYACAVSLTVCSSTQTPRTRPWSPPLPCVWPTWAR